MPTTLNVILFVSLGWLCHKMLLFIFELFNTNTGWPTKMSIFFFGINFDKNKDTFKIFSAVTFFLHEVFKCSVREMRWCLISRTEHLNTSGITSHAIDSFHVKSITPGNPIPKISTRPTFF